MADPNRVVVKNNPQAEMLLRNLLDADTFVKIGVLQAPQSGERISTDDKKKVRKPKKKRAKKAKTRGKKAKGKKATSKRSKPKRKTRKLYNANSSLQNQYKKFSNVRNRSLRSAKRSGTLLKPNRKRSGSVSKFRKKSKPKRKKVEKFTTSDKLTLGQIAYWHEFGRGNNPQRSFIRSTYDTLGKKKIADNVVRLLRKETKKDNPDYTKTMNLVGVWMVGKVKRTFTNNNWPKLKPATIKRKGSSRPLIDTGQLRASIAYEVIEGKTS